MEFCLNLFLALLLTANIDAITATPPLDHALWGIEIEDDAGNVLYSRNAHALMIPASNRKLFSAATDANCLGFDARLTTELWLDGEDVVLRGDGDPSFGSQRHESAGLTEMIASLRQRNVRHVRDVIADVSRFSDRITFPGGWKNGNLMSTDAAPVDALTYDESVADGTAVADAGLFAAQRLREAMELAGIRVGGRVRLNTAPRAWRERIAIVESPFVAQLLGTVLKNSHNLYAEALFKRSSPSGTYEESEDLERRFVIDEVGVDAAEFRFVDGCGLAPDNLATPAAIVKMMLWMNAPQRRATWWFLLAKPGEEGTLHYRLKDLGDRLVAKSGTVNGVNALSGIVHGHDGHDRYFSIIINHHLAGSADALRAIDAIVSELAAF